MSVDATSAYFAIALLALVTLGTRLGGATVMRFVTFSPRVTVFLEAMSASVLAAIVVTFVVSNETREAAAVGIALLIMLATRSAIWAMVGGLLTGAAWTFLLA